MILAELSFEQGAHGEDWRGTRDLLNRWTGSW